MSRRAELGVLAAFAVWSLVPVVLLVVWVGSRGGVATGATGLDAYDQAQYLAWIRDASTHLLSANLFGLVRLHRDFLHPTYAVSGGLVALGVPIPLAYLAWRPVSIAVLALGSAAYVRRRMAPGPARAATLALALLWITPLRPLLSGAFSGLNSLGLDVAADEASSATLAWSADHAALAVGLLPVFLLGVERLLESGGPSRRLTAGTAGVGLLVSWLHAWQGATLLAILAGLVVLERPRRRHRVLALPVLATLAPLLYFALLARADPSWALAARRSREFDIPLVPLLVVLAPPVALAVAGAGRRWPPGAGERLLRLWPVAVALVYLVDPEFPAHALQGLSLPLAILGVRGWQRVRRRMPARTAAAVALALLAVALAPGLVDTAGRLGSATTLAGPVARLTPDEHAALAVLEHAPGPGGVLGPPLLSLVVPAFTGRPVWTGHRLWTPDFARRSAAAGALFTRTVPAAGARALARASRARWVLADCRTPFSLDRALAPMTSGQRRFGCVRLLALRG